MSSTLALVGKDLFIDRSFRAACNNSDAVFLQVLIIL